MKNCKAWLGTLATLGLSVGLIFAGSASANGVTCDPADATANGAVADDCLTAGGTTNPDSEAVVINTAWQDDGGPFEYLGKYDWDSGAFEDADPSLGFTLTVTLNGAYPEDSAYVFAYELDNPALAGQQIEWVLGIKQASGDDSFTAYYWETVTMNVDGEFNSVWTNPAGNEVDDLSHASGFYRLIVSNGNGNGNGNGGDANGGDANGGDNGVPEPASIALFGGGMLALGWAIRRRTRKGDLG